MNDLTLLPQFRLSLLHRSDEHVANTSIGKSIETSTKAEGLDNKETFGAAVVSAIENSTSWETEGHPEFVARGTSACEYIIARVEYAVVKSPRLGCAPRFDILRIGLSLEDVSTA